MPRAGERGPSGNPSGNPFGGRERDIPRENLPKSPPMCAQLSMFGVVSPITRLLISMLFKLRKGRSTCSFLRTFECL